MSIHLSWCFELWIWDESLTWEFDISQFSYVLGPFSLKGWQKSCNRTYIYVATIATAKEFHCGQCSGGDFGRTQEATGRKVVETMQWPDLFIYYSSGFRDLGGSRWGMVGLLQLWVRGTDITIPHNVNIDLFWCVSCGRDMMVSSSSPIALSQE